MPTDESKARCEADKEGLMPTSSSHRRCLPGTQLKTKWRRPARYHNMAALCGDGTRWDVGKERKASRLCDPG